LSCIFTHALLYPRIARIAGRNTHTKAKRKCRNIYSFIHCICLPKVPFAVRFCAEIDTSVRVGSQQIHIRRCDGPGLVGGSKTNKVFGVTYGRKPPCAAWRDPPEQPARFQDPTHNVTQVRQKGISKKGSIENEEFSILRRLIIQPSALRDARRIYPTAHTKTRLYVLYMKASSKAF